MIGSSVELMLSFVCPVDSPLPVQKNVPYRRKKVTGSKVAKEAAVEEPLHSDGDEEPERLGAYLFIVS